MTFSQTAVQQCSCFTFVFEWKHFSLQTSFFIWVVMKLDKNINHWCTYLKGSLSQFETLVRADTRQSSAVRVWRRTKTGPGCVSYWFFPHPTEPTADKNNTCTSKLEARTVRLTTCRRVRAFSYYVVTEMLPLLWHTSHLWYRDRWSLKPPSLHPQTSEQLVMPKTNYLAVTPVCCPSWPWENPCRTTPSCVSFLTALNLCCSSEDWITFNLKGSDVVQSTAIRFSMLLCEFMKYNLNEKIFKRESSFF